MKLETMYQEIILDHYRKPLNRGLRSPFDAEVHHVNPTCGDEVTLRVDIELTDGDSIVKDVSYEAIGCSISQAATSVMTELVVGQPLADALKTQADYLDMMQSRGEVEPDEDKLGDAIAFVGVSKYPARIKCALLGWMAFKDAAAQAVTQMDIQKGVGMTESATAPSTDDLTEAMRDVVDPELGINVVDLGLLYGIHLDDGVVTIDMTLTSAACPLTDVIEDQTRVALGPFVNDVRINWVWMPPWGPDKITDDGREQLRALGFNV